jgi:hypothetical protein
MEPMEARCGVYACNSERGATSRRKGKGMTGTLRQKIEDNVFVYLAGVAVAAFGAGWGAYAAVIAVSGQTAGSKTQDNTLPSSMKPSSRPEYTQEVDEFLNYWFDKGVPPKDGLPTGYQWMGYREDINKLDELIKNFLNQLDNNPKMPYSEAQTFYDAIDEAASVISLNAQQSFIPAREGASELQTANYNQKVFLGPTWFRIRLEQLRREHQRGHMDKASIADFRQRFLEWRQNEGI